MQTIANRAYSQLAFRNPGRQNFALRRAMLLHLNGQYVYGG